MKHNTHRGMSTDETDEHQQSGPTILSHHWQLQRNRESLKFVDYYTPYHLNITCIEYFYDPKLIGMKCYIEMENVEMSIKNTHDYKN